MTTHNEQPLEAHSVFLSRKHDVGLFGPHSMDTQTDKALTLVLEISLYALFGSFITVMVLIPSEAARIQAMFPNTPLTDPVGFVLWIKMTFFIASLVPLFWGLHLSSKRLQGRLFAKRAA